MEDTFAKTDEVLLKPKGGFFGAMGERGVGGSKCGATCALALVLQAPPPPLPSPARTHGAARRISSCSHRQSLAGWRTGFRRGREGAEAQGKDGKRQLLSANVGDARVILARGTDGLQLSEDHVPDQWASPTARPTAQLLGFQRPD